MSPCSMASVSLGGGFGDFGNFRDVGNVGVAASGKQAQKHGISQNHTKNLVYIFSFS